MKVHGDEKYKSNPLLKSKYQNLNFVEESVIESFYSEKTASQTIDGTTLQGGPQVFFQDAVELLGDPQALQGGAVPLEHIITR